MMKIIENKDMVDNCMRLFGLFFYIYSNVRVGG